MFRFVPGSLPSLFTPGKTPDRVSGTASRSTSTDAIPARVGLAPKQTGFLNRLLGRHRATQSPPPIAPAASHTARPETPEPSSPARRLATPVFSGTAATSFHTRFPLSRLDQLADRWGRFASARRLLPGHQTPDFTHVIDAARALHRCRPEDAYRPARQLQELLKAYLTPERCARWQRQMDKGGAQAGAAVKKSRTIHEIRMAVEHLLEHQFAPQFAPHLAPLPTSDALARRIATAQHAAFLARHVGTSTATAGSSEVQLIRNAEQGVRFAFKPVRGESPQNLVPQGGAALREKLCSLLNDEVAAATGLDFGFPSVEIVSHQGDYGALVQGVPGRNMDADALAMNVDATDEGLDRLGRTRRLWNLQADRIEPREIQKVMLANLAMGNVDIKWGNLMMDRQGRCRPIDGGSAFPTRSALASISARAVPPDALCEGPAGGPLPAGDQPFDAELRAQFLAIDTEALAGRLEAHRQRLLDELPPGFIVASGTPDRDTLLDTQALQAGIRSLQATQRILRDSPECSMRALAQRYITELQASVPVSDVEAFERLSRTHSFNNPHKLNRFLAAFERDAGPPPLGKVS